MIKVWLMGDSPLTLWGLDGRTRLQRQVKTLGDPEVVREWSALAGADQVLLVRIDHVFEVRALSSLLTQTGVLMADDRPAAAFVPAGMAEAARDQLETGTGPMCRPRVSISKRSSCLTTTAAVGRSFGSFATID